MTIKRMIRVSCRIFRIKVTFLNGKNNGSTSAWKRPRKKVVRKTWQSLYLVIYFQHSRLSNHLLLANRNNKMTMIIK